jgi:hypothetical protein
MRERLRDLPGSLQMAALLMIVVPALLWLFLVWDTRPYSPEEIAADRARVEAKHDPDGYPTACLSFRCFRIDTHETYLEREELSLGGGGPSKWVTLSLAALVFVIGTRWPTGAGARAFLARAGGVFAFGTITALAISLAWWWGLEWIAEQRGLEDTSGPDEAARRASLVVGLSGVVGLAVAAQMRGALSRVVSISAAAVAFGVVVLIANPLEPWLPIFNVEAFLYGDQSYDIPRNEIVCTPSDTETRMWIGENLAYISTPDICTPYFRTRTNDDAAVYLFGLTGALLSAACLTRVRR